MKFGNKKSISNADSFKDKLRQRHIFTGHKTFIIYIYTWSLMDIWQKKTSKW